MQHKKHLWCLIALLLALAVASGCSTKNYDTFAKCLSEKGVKMYGAYWCSHCENQKEMFGDSWKYVNYVECSLPNRGGQTGICKDAKIEGYPTWEFADGSRLSGELSFETLSQKSGCQIEQP
ncbi:MAG TPA: hypothetical protein VJI46_05505 [Candidatus Nanoarchaeia archaeon]|nr:hypothetical protein [Candidatus Nanoarchaeia archaeon]